MLSIFWKKCPIFEKNSSNCYQILNEILVWSGNGCNVYGHYIHVVKDIIIILLIWLGWL